MILLPNSRRTGRLIIINMAINIKINGEDKSVNEGVTFRQLLNDFEIKTIGIAVERNRIIVPKSTFDTATVNDGDEIEIVRMVGGG